MTEGEGRGSVTGQAGREEEQEEEEERRCAWERGRQPSTPSPPRRRRQQPWLGGQATTTGVQGASPGGRVTVDVRSGALVVLSSVLVSPMGCPPQARRCGPLAATLGYSIYSDGRVPEHFSRLGG